MLDSTIAAIDPTAYDERDDNPLSFDEIDIPPCEEYGCPNITKCGERGLACKGFVKYINHGAVEQFGEDLMNPTRSIYMKLYPETAEA